MAKAAGDWLAGWLAGMACVNVEGSTSHSLEVASLEAGDGACEKEHVKIRECLRTLKPFEYSCMERCPVSSGHVRYATGSLSRRKYYNFVGLHTGR